MGDPQPTSIERTQTFRGWAPRGSEPTLRVETAGQEKKSKVPKASTVIKVGLALLAGLVILAIIMIVGAVIAGPALCKDDEDKGKWYCQVAGVFQDVADSIWNWVLYLAIAAAAVFGAGTVKEKWEKERMKTEDRKRERDKERKKEKERKRRAEKAALQPRPSRSGRAS